jgi:hypothetical protein
MGLLREPFCPQTSQSSAQARRTQARRTQARRTSYPNSGVQKERQGLPRPGAPINTEPL